MKLSDSAAVLAACTAYLYCSATAYYHGLFRTLKLDADILSIGFHQSLYQGMIQNLTILFYLPCVFLLFFTCKLTWIEQCSISARKHGVFARTLIKLNKLFKSKVLAKKPNIIHNRNIAFLSTTAASLFLIQMINFEKNGETRANQIIDSLSNNPIENVKIPGTNQKYTFIFCGSTACAFYNSQDKIVKYYQSHNFDYRAELTNKKTEQNK